MHTVAHRVPQMECRGQVTLSPSEGTALSPGWEARPAGKAAPVSPGHLPSQEMSQMLIFRFIPWFLTRSNSYISDNRV